MAILVRRRLPKESPILVWSSSMKRPRAAKREPPTSNSIEMRDASSSRKGRFGEKLWKDGASTIAVLNGEIEPDTEIEEPAYAAFAVLPPMFLSKQSPP